MNLTTYKLNFFTIFTIYLISFSSCIINKTDFQVIKSQLKETGNAIKQIPQSVDANITRRLYKGNKEIINTLPDSVVLRLYKEDQIQSIRQ